MDNIKDKWVETGLLGGTPENRHEMLSKCLESQMKYNDNVFNKLSKHFRRISIPLLVRLINSLPEDLELIAGDCDNFHEIGALGTPLRDLMAEFSYTVELAEKARDKVISLVKDKTLRINHLIFKDGNVFLGVE